MKTFLRAALLTVLVASPGALNAQEAAPVQPEAAEVAAPALADADMAAAPALSAHLTAPPEGKGQVVFFRPSKFTGAAISYKVREGEAELGLLSNGAYFVHVTEPGAHTYVVHSEAKDELTLEVEPGETYYVTSALSMGVMVGRPNISPADQAAFDGVFAKLKLAKPIKAKS